MTHDPYTIWVSEIILQQTRVDQGTIYFNRFMTTFPDIRSLASSSENAVLKIWQGLGYYSRARNLHKASRIIMEKYHGVFPLNYDEIINLPGIGEYTASAIVSFAGNMPYPVVDGNVWRVLSRIFGIDSPAGSSRGKKMVTAKAFELMDKNDPCTFNQAIMEFGALLCKPVNPGCHHCLFKKDCFAFRNATVHSFPPQKRPVVQRERYLNYLIIFCNLDGKTCFFLRKRVGKDIWRNMYDFPVVETDHETTQEYLQSMAGVLMNQTKPVLLQNSGQTLKHILTHQVIHADFFFFKADNYSAFEKIGKKMNIPVETVTGDTLSLYPVSRLIEKFFEKKPPQNW
jgi:A/G-specific adenine glycosylase